MDYYNSVYAEIKVNGHWFSINPIIKSFDGNHYQIKPVIEG